VVVLAGGVDDQIRLEFVQDGEDHPVEHHEEPFVGSLRGKGDVDRRAQSVRPAELVTGTGSGVEGPAVLVDGDAQGVGIVPVDVLGSVPVVAVRVDDSDPFGTVMPANVLDHDRFDVHVAETAGAMDHEHGVVPRRTYQGEGIVHLAGEDLLRCCNGAACRDEVGFRDHAACIGDADVRPVDILGCGDSGLVLVNILEIQEALLEDLILGVEETLLPFGMVGRDGPIEGGKKDQTGTLRHFQ